MPIHEINVHYFILAAAAARTTIFLIPRNSTQVKVFGVLCIAWKKRNGYNVQKK